MTKRRAAALLALPYLPLVGLIAVCGFAFGWRVPVGIALMIALLYIRVQTGLRWPYDPNPHRLRVGLDLLVSAFVGALAGALLFGGVGGILGVAIAVIWTVAAIPVTTKDAQGARVPLTLQSSPSTARVLTVLGFVLPVFLLGLCVVLLVAH